LHQVIARRRVDLRPAEEVIVNENAGSTDEIQATVPLRVSRGGGIDVTRAIDALTNLDWLGPQVNGPAELHDLRRVRTVLEFPIFDGSGPTPISKTAMVDIGLPAAFAGGVAVQIGWQSDSLSPLFPVFAGQLLVTAMILVLDGLYAPPFGRIGLMIDRHLLHFVARRTAEAFLARFAAHIEA
jgi:hypothetical protein